MDFLNGNIKTLYFKYLAAAFGSALITSIYSIVDMAMVGQYHGPEGAAALAVVAPVWNIIYSLGLLMGIGGSVLFGTIRGKEEQGVKRSNEYFTLSIAGAVVLALAAWLRNDGNPGRATAGVLSGGIFNIFGDYFFVFVCDMGAFGAGLATAIGTVISILVMASHFLSKKNTLRLVRPSRLVRQMKDICVTGFSTFFIDIAMGILTILFNRQIMTYLGTSALSVYGVIVNVSTFVQCCAYSVGQASQPIFSTNFGARKGERIRETLKYALGTTTFFGIFWVLLCMAIPNQFIRIFMSPTEEVLRIAPGIIRCYGLSFLLLPLNIFSTYYFQAVMKPQAAFVVSISRGLVISGILILLLPATAGADSIWLAMPFTELVTAVYVVSMIVRYTRRVPGQGKRKEVLKEAQGLS